MDYSSRLCAILGTQLMELSSSYNVFTPCWEMARSCVERILKPLWWVHVDVVGPGSVQTGFEGISVGALTTESGSKFQGSDILSTSSQVRKKPPVHAEMFTGVHTWCTRQRCCVSGTCCEEMLTGADTCSTCETDQGVWQGEVLWHTQYLMFRVAYRCRDTCSTCETAQIMWARESLPTFSVPDV